MGHPLLSNLGPEPLSDDFCGAHLHRISRGRRIAVKNLLMDATIVAGVGNIYACEALHRAGVHPKRPAGRISRVRYDELADAVKYTLEMAIIAGGTTLRDFVSGDGRPGYFGHALEVYDREGAPCKRCEAPLRRSIIGQRSTYYCAICQR